MKTIGPLVSLENTSGMFLVRTLKSDRPGPRESLRLVDLGVSQTMSTDKILVGAAPPKK